jgi:energy-coupling factor transporter ATP-binding protein EcfA2
VKIDIHIHTKKIKSGDSELREIKPLSFCEIIKKTDVKICAITNHNYFDKKQYDEIVSQSEDYFQTWPGVELDIYENGDRGHLIVIVNPKYANDFFDSLTKATEGKSADAFFIGIKDAIKIFDPLDPVYIPHYVTKRPSISDEIIQILVENVTNKKRILKEVTNLISAGIFVSHGHKSIFGSDIQNWNDYVQVARALPDLRLPVESYEQFCLLLERDDSTIRTILDKKNHEEISVNPFKEDNSPIKLKIYNDINILFGSKGTGKTEILKALSKHYNNSGYKTSVYESNANSLDLKYDIKGTKLDLTSFSLDFDKCINEITQVRNSTESSVVSLIKYFEYFSSNETNKIAKRIKLGNFSLVDNKSLDDKVIEIQSLQKQLNIFSEFLKSNNVYEEIIGKELFEKLKSVLLEVDAKVKVGLNDGFVKSKSIKLFNHLINTFVSEISKKTGQPEKPIKTGFLDYASNRIEIEKSVKKIINVMGYKIAPKIEYVGDLGEKGKLFCKTSLVIQDGTITDSALKPVNNVMKTPQKSLAYMFKTILDELYSDSLFVKISDLNSIENGGSIASIEDLILFKRYFELNYTPYKPSNGESAMVLLHQELSDNKEIFLIDEPEKSLGNDYISDVIVPLLREHAYSGKRVIIATHDANIAVRTLPYNTIYREHDISCYHTYAGNPFSNNLVCQTPGKVDLDWKETSMRKLEGGKEAFGERGEIYGKL